MSNAPNIDPTKVDFEAISKLENTSAIMEVARKVREAKKADTEKTNREYKFPSRYNPKMGLKEGHVTELRMFFTVRPGHAEALKEELRKFKLNPERNSKATHLLTGIQDMTCTLFDNDTRYLHTTEFDTEWDPYIDDSIPTAKQQLMYANWFQHLEEAKQFGPNNLPTPNDVKVLFNQQRVTATCFIRTFGETTVEEYRLRDVKKAFDQVLDHPDAAKALEHPALKPLLDLAAD